MSGLVKAKKYDWKDSNMALFGSDTEKQVSAPGIMADSSCCSQTFCRSRKSPHKPKRLGTERDRRLECRFGESSNSKQVLYIFFPVKFH